MALLASSLPLMLPVEARQAREAARLDPLWAAAGPVAAADGTSVPLSALDAPDGGAAVWVVRVQAEWCGTCQWHAGWTPALADRFGDRVAIVDLLIADRDNAPVDAAALGRWQARTGSRATALMAGPDALAGAFRLPAPLPRVLVVDARTDPDRVTDAIAQVLTGASPPFRPAPVVDGRFTTDEWALITGMRLPPAPPSDPTNRFADDPAAATLGAALFFEKALSPVGIACSNCHNPDHLFAEQQNRPSYGSAVGKRNVLSPILLGQARVLFWDGRADSVWSQAIMPIEDEGEMASDRLFVAHVIRERYRADYETVFGPLPDLDDHSRFPRQGRPGAPAWAGMRPGDREAVSRVLANVGKALAAFERGLVVSPAALDRYAAGDLDAMSDVEKDGLAAFLDAGCAQCHFGPRLSNDAFHNLRFPTARADGLPDRGRADVLPAILANEFSRQSSFSDAPAEPPAPPRLDRALGAFRTPGLRGAAATAPYGHGGGFHTLRSVIEAHRTGGLPPDSPATVGEAEPWGQGFDPALTPRIVGFLNGLRAQLARYP
jgi:cytochrome c peroxidase